MNDAVMDTVFAIIGALIKWSAGAALVVILWLVVLGLLTYWYAKTDSRTSKIATEGFFVLTLIAIVVGLMMVVLG